MSFYSCICVLKPFKVNFISISLIVVSDIRFIHGATELHAIDIESRECSEIDSPGFCFLVSIRCLAKVSFLF